ncbi:glycogen/starch/alpha-glucan phosphorylase [Ligaoa zhengdingensis]|uniref:glycogen/starch/alpha-glucan phosphorylase n=2 Tax=Ligaoa zhengdingensis TaxID=2763658 RepID=UPI0031BA9AC4
MIEKEKLISELEEELEMEYQTTLERATPAQLHFALGRWASGALYSRWQGCRHSHANRKRAYYLSAEFLMGRLVFSNLYNMGVLDEVRAILADKGVDLACLEEVEDAALGNGGLGRLAACYLDSAATHNLPLDGYGIRYQYGLFKQAIVNGEQRESADDWQRQGDPWSLRCEADAVTVEFGDQTVNAVPYDMAVVGYGEGSVNTLRLWQAEAVEPFDFGLFNAQKYEEALRQKNEAENISRVLYPNDDTEAGKILRLKQQYFFTSASLKDILRRYKAVYGDDFSKFADSYAIQLNDTHPVIAIPELLRLLIDNERMEFNEAFEIAQKVFSYTNHTIMPEAMETWSAGLMAGVAPRVLEIIRLINERLIRELNARGLTRGQVLDYLILARGRVHMARLAVYVSHKTNGVARIHTEILKSHTLREWYQLYPERFVNKTNGITQRRWLGLCNPALASMITELLGSDRWITDLSELAGLRRYADDTAVLDRLIRIKQENKRRLCEHIKRHDGISLNPEFLFDIQVKRLHEYKRQLLNALSIIDIYFGIKEGRIENFTPTAFLFGAKAAPGYYRAKGIIKLIGEIARVVDSDPGVKNLLSVAFVQNYNVSYAELLMPAADVSEQISTAGTEASGTGNMKLALNGAVTLGTYDGANIEIVEQAGEENNYIFGLRVEEIDKLRPSYNPRQLYESNPRIRRVLDTLIDGTFDDGGTGVFQDLYDSLLKGASWHAPDQYFLLADFESYLDAKLRVNRDYRDRYGFARKCLLNIAGCGMFSSDRAIKEYADEIWGISDQ